MLRKRCRGGPCPEEVSQEPKPRLLRDCCEIARVCSNSWRWAAAETRHRACPCCMGLDFSWIPLSPGNNGRCAAALPCCYAAMLRRCDAAMVGCCDAAMLQRCDAATLRCCNAAMLQRSESLFLGRPATAQPTNRRKRKVACILPRFPPSNSGTGDLEGRAPPHAQQEVRQRQREPHAECTNRVSERKRTRSH